MIAHTHKGILKKTNEGWVVENTDGFYPPEKNPASAHDVSYQFNILPVNPSMWIEPIFDGYEIEYTRVRMYKNIHFDWSERIPPSQISNSTYGKYFAKIFYPVYPDCVCNCDKKTCAKTECFTHAKHEQITGHATLSDMESYDAGREDEQEVTMKWIAEWDGKTNSAMGALLKKKYIELFGNC